MLDTIPGLIGGALLFVGGHWLLSSAQLRPKLISALGENGFRIVYSLIVLAGMVWLVMAYGRAPYVEVWTLPAWRRAATLVLMLLSSVLVVLGGAGFNPSDEGPGAVGGVYAITRHPMLWGFVLFGIAHLLMRGDLASLFLFGSIIVLPLAGMAHIDARKRRAGGEAWQAFEAGTSAIPFAAIVAGRARMSAKGWRLWPLIAGVIVFAVLLIAHEWVIGVSPYAF